VSSRPQDFRAWPAWGTQPQLVEPDDLESWVLRHDDDLIVIDKPGWLVCHPSKRGPWSSLAGACREHFKLQKLHLVSRLDRETSGLVILARNPRTSRRLQTALEQRRVAKSYLAILTGEFTGERLVDAPIGPDILSAVAAKQACGQHVRRARPASSRFHALACGGGYTLAQVRPLTGRKHQIRAHTAHLGHPVAGDKLYGPDESLFLEFAEHGWTPRLQAALPFRRQALHAQCMHFHDPGGTQESFAAPLAPHMAAFAHEIMGLGHLPVPGTPDAPLSAPA